MITCVLWLYSIFMIMMTPMLMMTMMISWPETPLAVSVRACPRADSSAGSIGVANHAKMLLEMVIFYLPWFLSALQALYLHICIYAAEWLMVSSSEWWNFWKLMLRIHLFISWFFGQPCQDQVCRESSNMNAMVMIINRKVNNYQPQQW